MNTATMLADLRVEFAQSIEGSGGADSPTLVMYRPHSTGLRNDGFRAYWMLSGLDYRLAHDGTGWRVTCADWTDGHVLRLVDAVDGREFVSVLPTVDGAMDLVVGAVYELRANGSAGWTVYQL